YSALIPCLILIIVLDFINYKYFNYEYGNSFNFKTLLGNILMVQDFPIQNINEITFKLFSFNIFKGNPLTSFGSARPLWTIAIEWYIYLFYGYTYIIMLKKRNLTILNWVIFFLLSIIPLSNVTNGRGNGLFLYWLIGGAIFYLIKNVGEKFNKYVLIFLGILCLRWAFLFSLTKADYYDIKFVLLFCLALLLFLVAFKDSESKFVLNTNNKLKRIARYSYTLYLIHYSLIDLLVQVLKKENKYIVLLICIIASNLLALLMYEFGEKYSEIINIKLNKILNTFSKRVIT
ncbi:MAG: acyltransferase family protein, partial [Clostridiaceae bacterium]|nr:acyltransferase family protein [Clostridiaceae bacterium]